MTALALVAGILATASPDAISLREAMSAATVANPSVATSRSDLDAARARSAQAKGALLPTVTLVSDWSRTGPNLGDDPRRTSASRQDANDALWRTTLGARWTVFDGFRSWNALGATSARLRASDASYADAGAAARELAATRWLALWLAGRRETLAESTLATSRVRRAVSSVRREVGAEAGLETRQALLDARRDSLALLRAVVAREQAARALELALGRPAEGRARAEEPGSVDTTDPLEGRAPAEPADVRALREASDASARELSAARSTWWPELALYANHAWLESINDDDPPGSSWTSGMVYGATATWTLFEGGRTLSRTRESAASRERAATLLASREREAAGALDATRSRWNASRVAWTLESDNALQAQAVLDAALARYRAGSISGLDLRRYQDSRDQAAVAADEARADLVASRIALRRAAGLDPLP